MISWRRVPGSKTWHTFLDGADAPVCGVQAKRWVDQVFYGRRPVHKECVRLSGGARPRLNRPMTEEEIARELD